MNDVAGFGHFGREQLQVIENYNTDNGNLVMLEGENYFNWTNNDGVQVQIVLGDLVEENVTANAG